MPESFTLIEPDGIHAITAEIDRDTVQIAPEVLAGTLGWTLKPEGLCRGEVCVPVRDRGALVGESGIDLSAFADALGLPLALDAPERAAALGTAAADRAAALDGGIAPDFELPDLEGKLHRLSEHRGKKILLIAYASW